MNDDDATEFVNVNPSDKSVESVLLMKGNFSFFHCAITKLNKKKNNKTAHCSLLSHPAGRAYCTKSPPSPLLSFAIRPLERHSEKERRRDVYIYIKKREREKRTEE